MSERTDKINQTIEEKYVELALYEWLELEGKALLAEEEALKDLPEYQPSQKTIGKLQRQYRLANVKQSLKNMTNRMKPIVSRAAILFLVIFIAFSSVLFVSADARNMFYNLVISHTQRYSEIEGGETHSGLLNLPVYIPQGYGLRWMEGDGSSFTFRYENDAGSYVTIFVARGGTFRFDTEDAEQMETITLKNTEASLVIKEGQISIIWQNADQLFYVRTDANIQEAIKIAEGLTENEGAF